MDGTSVEPPTIIGGRYEVVAPLGEGGLATVFRVRHVQLGSDHALKILKLQAKGIRERLMLEGRVQATIRHPNLVAVTDVVEVDGAPGLIMEFVDGPDLHHFLQATRLRGRDLDEMVEGILSAVAEAHSKGLVHRDLKPGNILVAKAGGKLIPKITDFGLAKLLDSDERNSSTTRTGMTMGTPAYMAPEQIRDAKNVDHRADIFSLGAILYEMATGQKAFPGEDILELFMAIANGRYKPPRELEPELPERMVKAIAGALQVDLDARTQDCGTLLATWRGEAAGAESPALPTPKLRRATTASSTSNPTYNDEAVDTLAPRSAAPAKAPSLAPPPPKTRAAAVSPPPVRKGPPLWFLAVAGAALLTIAGSTVLLVGVLGYAALPSTTSADVSLPPAPAPAPAPAPDPSPTGTTSSGTPSTATTTATSSGTTPPEPSTGTTSSGTTSPETSSGTTSSGTTSPETSSGTVSSETSSGTASSATSDAKTSSGTAFSGTTSSKKRTSTSAASAPASTPAPAPSPTPAPAPVDAAPPADAAPALAPNEALVKVSGDAKRVWLQGATGRFPAGAVPAGTYHITAFFDAGDPVSIGDVDLSAAETLTVRCSAEMRTCRYQEAK